MQAFPGPSTTLDAETGKAIHRTDYRGNWNEHYAPTPFDGHAYIHGPAIYAGSIEIATGEPLWWSVLPQYDDWTPAVDERYVYAYMGQYDPGLYVIERFTGELVDFIPDERFQWSGWDMDLSPVLGGMDDVIAIHGGRIMRFDLERGNIAWQREGAWQGQPAVARGVIYAVEGPELVALDQRTGQDLWRWNNGTRYYIRDEVLVTDSHVFVGTSSTHAIGLASRRVEWSYPLVGTLAIADDTLFIANYGGVAAAISLTEVEPARVTHLEIVAPVGISKSTAVQLGAEVSYDDGRVRDRTPSVEWSVHQTHLASITDDGLIEVTPGGPSKLLLTVTARYEEDGTDVSDTARVPILVPPSK